MILMITKENEKLISEVCLENNIEDYQILTTVANLYNFTVTELKSLNNFTQLVIDITSINDTEKQLIDAIVTLKTIYMNLRITILAIGYQPGNTLLSKLFSESIFNFVTATEYHTQKEEFRKCLTVGNSYSDSIGYRYKENNKDTQKSKVIIKKEYRNHGYSRILNDAILKEAKYRGFLTLYLKTDLKNYYEKFGAVFIKKLKSGESLYKFEI